MALAKGTRGKDDDKPRKKRKRRRIPPIAPPPVGGPGHGFRSDYPLVSRSQPGPLPLGTGGRGVGEFFEDVGRFIASPVTDPLVRGAGQVQSGRPARQAATEAVGEAVGNLGGAALELGVGPTFRTAFEGGQANPFLLAGEIGLAALPIPGAGKLMSGGRRAFGSRVLKYGELTAQAARSPSRITSLAQRVTDSISDRLTPTVATLRESDSPLARAAGTTLTPFSTRGRVPRIQGRSRALEQQRKASARAHELHVLGQHGKSSGPFEVAQHWYSQLPEAQRNPDGLKLARDQLSVEREWYTSGRAREELTAEIDALKAQQKAADDVNEVWELQERIAKIRLHLQQAKRITEDQTAAIAKLDAAIAKDVPFDEETFNAISVLNDDREAILARARGEDAEEIMAGRRGIVSRWLGMESDGTEQFVGHRAFENRTERMVPGAASRGKTRPPKGFYTKDNLVLVRRGQQRTDLRSVIDDWQAAEKFELVNNVKEDLAKVGRPFDGTIHPTREVLLNPKAKPVPRSMLADPEAKLAAEGFDDEFVGYVRDTVAVNKEEMDRLAAAAPWEDLVVVPRDVFDRYWNQFVTFRPANLGSEGKAVLNSVKKGITGVNDVVALSLIYSNPLAYIPANLGGNILFAGLHQGIFLLPNLMRAGQLLAQADKTQRAQILTEVGELATTAIAQGRILKKPARWEGMVTDAAPRVSAWLHEAARQGVIPKLKPTLDDADFQKIFAFINNPENRPRLNDITETVNRAMVDFRLNPWERDFVRRAVFIYPWIKGSAKYPFQYVKDHPVQSAVMAGLGYHYRDDIEGAFDNDLPSFMKPALKVGEKRLPVGPFSPLGTMLSLYGSATDQPGARRIGEMLRPEFGAIADFARGRDQYGREVGYGPAGASIGKRLTPLSGFVGDLISPSGEGLYPEDATRAGRLKRTTRVIPYAVDPKTAKDLVRLETGTREPVSAKIRKERGTLRNQARKVGIQLPPEVITAAENRVRLNEKAKEGRRALEKELGVDRLTERQQDAVRLGSALELIAESDPQLAQELGQIAAQGDPELREAVLSDAESYLFSLLDAYRDDISALLAEVPVGG